MDHYYISIKVRVVLYRKRIFGFEISFSIVSVGI